jgi:magnesium transporter
VGREVKYGLKARNVPSFVDDFALPFILCEALGDVELLRQLGKHFRIHPLALEDVLTTGQRPKVDGYEGQLFIPKDRQSLNPESFKD